MIHTLMMLTLVGQPFFDGNSVALSIRSNSFFVNPAGLGIGPGVELQYNRTFPSLQNIAIDLAGLGFAARLRSDTARPQSASYQLGVGLPLAKTFALGYSYGFGAEKVHTVGALGRGGRWLSLGLTSEVRRSPLVRAGIGVRPLTDRLTLFFDATYRDSLTGFSYGAGVEPIDGILLSFAGTRENRFRFGLDLSLGNLKLGGGASGRFDAGDAGIIVSDKTYPTFLPRRKRLVEVTLDGDYPEQKESGLLIGFGLSHRPAFYNLVRRLADLKDRPDCAGVLLNLKSFTLGVAQTEELRSVLADLKRQGKKIFAFAYGYDGLKNYYLASVADEIILVPMGDVSIPGVMMMSPYLKGTLEKLGIETDVLHIGKYKSAVELFTRTGMSDADREQRGLIVDSVYSMFTRTIARDRGIDPDTLDALVNRAAFFNATEALERKLVDTVAFASQLDEVLKARTGKRWSRQPLGKFLARREVDRRWQDTKPRIALVIAEGDIIVGASGTSPLPIPFIGGSWLGSETVSALLKKVKDDRTIKAVVFRINSGGGSALASEIIAQALKQLKGKKPIVVSMGNVAGSGGYYIACFGDQIYADRSTITGSIGILSVKLVTRGLYDKLGITWDAVKKGEHVDAFSDLRHFTPDESARAGRELQYGYDQFLRRVAEGRNKTTDYIHSLGQGRIWSGDKAKEIGLVDEVGGLLDAIERAMELAGLKNKEVTVAIYPAPERRFTFNIGASVAAPEWEIVKSPFVRMLREPRLYLMDEGVEFKD